MTGEYGFPATRISFRSFVPDGGGARPCGGLWSLAWLLLPSGQCGVCRVYGEDAMRNSLKKAVAVLGLVALLGGCAATEHRETAGQFVDDSTVTARIKTAMLNDSELKANEIHVETMKGVVQLSGFVGSKAEADRAARVAREIPGVKSVVNDLHVR
jgi:hypothetical protein